MSWDDQEVFRSMEAQHGRRVGGVLLRGYVTKVYYLDDVETPISSTETVRTVLCDVTLTESGWHGLLRSVPLLRQSGGVWDSETWKPRAATVNLSGGTLVETEGSNKTGQQDMDGDHVVVGFLGGDIYCPVVVGQLDHPRGFHGVSTADAVRYKWARWLRGIRLAVTEDGGLEIDLSSASAGDVQSDGSESLTGDATLTVTTKTAGSVVISENGRVVVTQGSGSVEVDGSGQMTVETAGQKLTVNGSVGLVEAVLKSGLGSDLAGVLTELVSAVGAAAVGTVNLTPNANAMITQLLAGAYDAASLETD